MKPLFDDIKKIPTIDTRSGRLSVDEVTEIIQSTPEYKEGKRILADLGIIKEAVDIAVGDDGMRGEEVVEIIESMSKVPVITGDRDTDALLEDERIAQEEE